MRTDWKRILGTVVLGLVTAGCGAAVKMGGEMTLEEMARRSDAIVIGQCKAKKARWVRGHIETDYEVQVGEALKGGKQFRPGARFRMTVMGGEMTTPPINQFTEMQAHMHVGEDVALFLTTKPAGSDEARSKAASMGSNLLTTPRVVGMNEGKFSIITDARDGRRKLTRVRLEDYGFFPNDNSLARVLKAVASHEVTVTSEPVVRLGRGLVTSPEGKAALDRAAQAAQAAPQGAGDKRLDAVLQAADAATSQAQARRFRNGGPGQAAPIAVQDLEDFKNQVRQFAN